VRATEARIDWPHGTRLVLHVDGIRREARLRLLGRVMVYPFMVAVAVAVDGESWEDSTLSDAEQAACAVPAAAAATAVTTFGCDISAPLSSALSRPRFVPVGGLRGSVRPTRPGAAPMAAVTLRPRRDAREGARRSGCSCDPRSGPAPR
jgi:hypothetical protein